MLLVIRLLLMCACMNACEYTSANGGNVSFNLGLNIKTLQAAKSKWRRWPVDVNRPFCHKWLKCTIDKTLDSALFLFIAFICTFFFLFLILLFSFIFRASGLKLLAFNSLAFHFISFRSLSFLSLIFKWTYSSDLPSLFH